MSYDGIQLEPNAKWMHETSAEIQIKQIEGHTDSINNCQLIQNNEIIFTVSDDRTARIWNFFTGKQLNVYENIHDGVIPQGKVSSDCGKFITCSWDKTIKCWDLETGKLLWKNFHDYLVTSCCFSADNNHVASASDVDFHVKVWDTKTGKLAFTLPVNHKSTITSCNFTPKNDRIVTTSMDKTCKFYDTIAQKTTITLGSHKSIISGCSFTHDERRFATCSWDKTIQIWDIATGMYRKNGPSTLSKGHEGSISSCSISKDATMCVSGGYDTRVVLWDMISLNPKLILRGHSDWVNDVKFSDDNKWIVSVGKDKTIKEWNIENCDNIKLVAEQNKNQGNKLIRCTNCSRSFAVAKIEKKDETKQLCVFCRLN